jgi:excisionase family DNA binding protein
MPAPKHRDVLTTGQVAKICNVAPRTVSKWFDSGQLRGYRIPGSKDRRIPVSQLVRFMRAHGIPLGAFETGITRVLVVDNDRDIVGLVKENLESDAGYQVEVAAHAFAAGCLAERLRPHVIVLDVEMDTCDGAQVCKHLRDDPELTGAKVIATGSQMTEQQGQALLHKGYHGYVAKPFQLRQLVAAIEDAMAIVY